MGDCLDARSLAITNQPLWAEPDVAEPRASRCARVYDDRDAAAALGARGRAYGGRDGFRGTSTARRLVEIAAELRAEARLRGT